MCRMLFAFNHGLKHYRELKAIRRHGYGAISDLNLSTLPDQGIDIIVFDFDGVLAAHGELQPSSIGMDKLKQSLAIFGENNVYILSNKPLKVREQFFNEHLPGIQFVYAPRKKPYPDGLQQIMQSADCAGKQIALIDDRLLTGGLATCIAGTKMIYINKPLQNFKKRFFKESFFHLLRVSEKLFF